MSRKPFALLVIALTIFVGYVLVIGGRLPGALRREIDTEQHRLNDARKQIAKDRDEISKDASSNAQVFQAGNFDTQWQSQMADATAALAEAQRCGDRLADLERANHRSDVSQAQELLRREQASRERAVRLADMLLLQARRRADLKSHFGDNLKRIETGSARLQAADYSATIEAVHKAEQDWPAKKSDLERRLDTILDSRQRAADWNQLAKGLETKPVAQLTTADYAAVLDAEDGIEHAPSVDAQQLTGLSHQLYTSWDDVLIDLDKNPFRERIKHVVTTVNAPAEKGTTVAQESWRDVPEDTWKLVENDLGMAIAHKPFGEYDSEATHTPEPAGFAYMASPAEGHNQYGYWEHRDGGSFWHWLPEYLILRDLLSNRSYVPIPSYDWDHYRQAQRYGRTYYGTESSGEPKYGSHGTFTQRNYSSSRYVQSGGFAGSKYTAGGRGAPSMGSSSSNGRKFGPSLGDSGGHKFGGSSSGRSFGHSSRSMGRSFGRR